MRRQLILCAILSIFGCGAPDLDLGMGPANWGANFEGVDWVITLDSVSSANSGHAGQITTISNEYTVLYHTVPLPDGEGVHSLRLMGTCHAVYHDSTLYPDYIFAEARNIWFSKLDSTAYWKEYARTVNGFGELFYEFKNPDTTFTFTGSWESFKWDDFDANSLIRPFGLDQPFHSDSSGNFILEVDLPAVIKGDSLSLEISPQTSFISRPGEKTLIFQGGVFTLIFQNDEPS